MDHPMVVEIERTGYPSNLQPDEFYCDCCGDEIDGECFEFDGHIYCNVSCLTKNTDIRYGNVYEFK